MISNEVETFVPTKAKIPEGKEKNKALGVKNFASNHETVKKFAEVVKNLYEFHSEQSQRQDLEYRMDAIDKYCRVMVAPAKTDADKTPDITDWKPPQLMSAIDILTANQGEVLFPRNEHIGKFVPYNDLSASARSTTVELLRRQNLLFEYSNEVDNRIPKYQGSIWRANKYGDCIVEMGWMHRKWPALTPAVKSAIPMVGKNKDQIESHSTFKFHDFKDFYCDLLLDDDSDIRGSLQSQNGIEIRCRVLYGDMRQRQRDGEYQNVEFINQNQLYMGESPSNRLQQRHANAGEASDTERMTGEYELWEGWARVPIDDNGDWDEDKNEARWFWGTFAGRMDTQSIGTEAPKKGENGLICLRLNPNPYPYDELPFTVIHSKRDDKGLMHKSYYEDSLSILEILQRINNAYVYNKDLVNASPWKVGRGALFGDGKFDGGPTSLIQMADGRFSELERIVVQSNTQDSQAMISYLERIFWEDIMLMPKGFRGKEMGSRTSASEATAANAQAAKPFLDRVRYIGYQLIGFCARKNAIYTAHFQPEAITRALTSNGSTAEVKPSDIYGPLRYKLTAVDDYEKNIMERAEQDRFAQIWLPILAPFIGKRGVLEAGRWAWAKRGAPIEKIFPAPTEGDAVVNASRENDAMLQGQFDAPRPDEDHDVHINTHRNFLSVLKTQPRDDAPPQTVGYIQAHILLHEQMQQQQSQQIQQGVEQQQQNVQGGQPATGLGTGETPAMTGGEVGQDTLGAIGGQLGG